MPKTGHPLREVPGFDPALVLRLRDELSVTTAEEFVGLWRSAAGSLAHLFGGSKEASRLAEAATSAIGSERLEEIVQAESSRYPYFTGHDAPPAGKKTY